MRPPVLRLALDDDEMVVDNFAGGGGASTGIKMATGRDPDIAVNHDPQALAIYKANHPDTRVMCEDVFAVKPKFVVGRRKVGLAWFSPDCTFFSKARGQKPHRDRNPARRKRGLAGVALKWAEQVRPRVVCIENVEEFKDWGPIIWSEKQKGWIPDPEKKGTSYARWISRWENLGYKHKSWPLRACDYGAPTTRKRLFIVLRCDGEEIVEPVPTHAPRDKAAELGKTPYRTAAECIDWSIPCPSIFISKEEAKQRGFGSVRRPLSEATQKRIARGVVKYLLESAEPFVVKFQQNSIGQPLDEPLHTVMAGAARFGVVAPVIAPVKSWGGGGNDAKPANEPMRTVTTSKRGEFAIIAPTLIQTSWGEWKGQKPRTLDLHAPLGTIMADGIKHSVVAAFLAKSYGGPGALKKQPPGRPMTAPVDTITAKDYNVLVSSSIVKLKGTCKDGQAVTEPLATVQAQGLHYAEVRAFLMKFYDLDLGGDEVVTVTIDGEVYVIVDIGMRMLTARELFNAQGFPSNYVINPLVEVRNKKGRLYKRRLTKTEQVHKCGNSVPPPFSEALVRAQFQVKPAANVA